MSEPWSEWTEEINLRMRLIAAERFCRAFGMCSGWDTGTERQKAAFQAWAEWQTHYGRGLPRLTDEEIADLAAKRDITHEATLLSIRSEYGGGPEITAKDFEDKL